ncbi:Uncharacterised protein [Alistipes sp. cv1]|nr:Uncharacterised protein [Faecalibacterium prausnitzii]
MGRDGHQKVCSFFRLQVFGRYAHRQHRSGVSEFRGIHIRPRRRQVQGQGNLLRGHYAASDGIFLRRRGEYRPTEVGRNAGRGSGCGEDDGAVGPGRSERPFDDRYGPEKLHGFGLCRRGRHPQRGGRHRQVDQPGRRDRRIREGAVLQPVQPRGSERDRQAESRCEVRAFRRRESRPSDLDHNGHRRRHCDGGRAGGRGYEAQRVQLGPVRSERRLRGRR